MLVYLVHFFNIIILYFDLEIKAFNTDIRKHLISNNAKSVWNCLDKNIGNAKSL